MFVSDLDGTLLRKNARISDDSCRIINALTDQGILFSYATARSIMTSTVVARGLVCNVPVITHNGVFIIDPATREILRKNMFSECEAEDIYEILRRNKVFPLVFSYQDGRERFSYDNTAVSEGIRWFLGTHVNDERELPLTGDEKILSGEVFYFSCIGTREMLEAAYKEIRCKYRCIFSKDTYGDRMWLEIMPMQATKADALLQLREMMGCDYIVAFGDGINDIPMFKIADESYAVENAAEELKDIATGIIDTNEHDGVARWLRENCGRYRQESIGKQQKRAAGMEENMNKIASFTVNHIDLLTGIYVSRRDRIGDQVLTTFDLRFTRPNVEPVMDTAGIHTIEHLGATFLRNHRDWKDRTIYFGPMGCRTGFYVIFAGDLESKDIAGVIGEMMDYIIGFSDRECDIPGYSPRDCGNYLDNNVMEAKTYARKFKAEVLDGLCEERMRYPE